jgi:hypothetical protein
VIEAVDAGTAAEVVPLDERLDAIDVVYELDREAERVDGAHGFPETGCGAGRHASRGAAAHGEEALGTIEVVRGANPKTHPLARRSRTLAKRHAVMDELLVPAQVQRVGLLVLDVESDEVDPPCAGSRQVGDDQVDIGGAHDVGRFIHGGSPTPAGRRRRACRAA